MKKLGAGGEKKLRSEVGSGSYLIFCAVVAGAVIEIHKQVGSYALSIIMGLSAVVALTLFTVWLTREFFKENVGVAVPISVGAATIFVVDALLTAIYFSTSLHTTMRSSVFEVAMYLISVSIAILAARIMRKKLFS